MIIQADKEKVLKEFEEKYVQDRYVSEFEKIIEEYKISRESIRSKLVLYFRSLCKKAISLQEKGCKGEIRYIYFSMLRTKLLENKGQWRIDLYDEKWFLDPSFYFGINIGGAEKKEVWKDNLNEKNLIKDTYVEISDK